MIERAVDEPEAAAKAALYAQAGLIYLDQARDPSRARDRFEQAVRLDSEGPGGWEGLGRMQGAEGRAALAAGLHAHVAARRFGWARRA